MITAPETPAACPFCGGENCTAQYIRDGRRVVCHDCGAAGPSEFNGRDDQPSATERAIEKWNRRAQ